MGTPIALHETTPRPISRRLETAGEIEMAMRMKRVLYSAVASWALAGALYVPARAAGLNIETATIADLNAAFAGGTLTSEHLVSAYLKRIEAYDKQGPAINAIIALNKKALDEARQLDAERKSGKVRGPLHGIPVVLKDNYDTVDMPTTAGSQLLEGHMAKQDAFMVKKLREAGAIVLAKVNLSEFAGSGGSVSGATDPAIIKAGSIPNGSSSAGGQTKNPHELLHGPAGSSGGTGAAVAAAFAQFGLGTDTGGSVRGPSSANGIVGLKPTHGLLSRAGIVPLALSFDTGGPMARSVYDVAVALGVMTGVDPADDATKKSQGKSERDYTKYLKTGALKGARIGIARDFMGKDAGTDEVVEAAIVTLKKLGAVVIDPITSPRPAQYIKPDGLPAPTDSPTNLANESGFPDLIVPAGMTWSGLPVTISFFGQAFSEGQLLGYGYDFEQATKARVLPKHTPALPSDVLGMAVAQKTP